jgi:hypothetical protein
LFTLVVSLTRPMPRHRPGKRQREIKRAQDQQALNKMNERIHGERDTTENANRVEKHTSERQFSATEVNAIVQAAVSAAVTATVTATKELVTESKQTENGTSSKQNNKLKSLAEQITKQLKLSLADRISFPKKNLSWRIRIENHSVGKARPSNHRELLVPPAQFHRRNRHSELKLLHHHQLHRRRRTMTWRAHLATPHLGSTDYPKETSPR